MVKNLESRRTRHNDSRRELPPCWACAYGEMRSSRPRPRACVHVCTACRWHVNGPGAAKQAAVGCGRGWFTHHKRLRNKKKERLSNTACRCFNTMPCSQAYNLGCAAGCTGQGTSETEQTKNPGLTYRGHNTAPIFLPQAAWQGGAQKTTCMANSRTVRPSQSPAFPRPRCRRETGTRVI